MAIPRRRYLLMLAVLFAIWWVALAIRPWDRATWVLENALAVIAVACLGGLHRRLLWAWA